MEATTAPNITKQFDGFYADWLSGYTIDRLSPGEWKLNGPGVRTDYPFAGSLDECKREATKLAKWAL